MLGVAIRVNPISMTINLGIYFYFINVQLASFLTPMGVNGLDFGCWDRGSGPRKPG